ncbi:MAG: hypothetical protein R3281_13915 [Balneolaceae bacterium]|nr:hypothetical protein [Balneolaceae bacterium]
MWRQKVPGNLPTMVRVLLEAGADPHSTMNGYNRVLTVQELITTSVHPEKAGVKDRLLQVIEDAL